MSDEPEDTLEADGELPGRRLYTVAGANALIPHLGRVFDRLDAGRVQIQELVEELASLGVQIGHAVPPPLAADPEVRPLLEVLFEVNEELREVLSELSELGVEIKGLDGLVDVRSRYEGRIVYLCWRRGEPAFTHWHELEAGFPGRAPILEADDFEGTLLV
ncbi:MAG: DUF2203 domain-containing protein [Deltaproteobacteria bacterium HGW-Deltaproteobacteria-14]|jgi:hypothetical protein|nr:MAG: DUF2203 domain-containing protein [Deltaproteobacteria bacterium HGW-Deltaproteobacteria-14]